jgi:hypothetical protein
MQKSRVLCVIVTGLFLALHQAKADINWLSAVPEGYFNVAENWTGGIIPTNTTAGYFTGNQDYLIHFPTGGLIENSVTKVGGLTSGRSLAFDTLGTWWLKAAPEGTNRWPSAWTGFQIQNGSGNHLFNIEGLSTSDSSTNYPIMLMSNAIFRVNSYSSVVTNTLEQGLLNLYNPGGVVNNGHSLITGSAWTRHYAIFKAASTLRANQIRMRGTPLGNIMIFEGGAHEIYNGLQLGEGSTGAGVTNTVLVAGGTLSLPTGTLYIGNGKTGSRAEMSITGTGAVTAHNQILMAGNQTYPTNSSSLLLRDTASLRTDNYMDVAYASSSTGTIDVAGSASLSVAMNLAIARGNNSVSTMTLRDQATCYVGGYLLIGGYSGSDGWVSVQDDAILTAAASYCEAGSNSGTGRLELVGGRIIAKNVRGGAAGWSEFYADGGTLCASNIATSVKLVENFDQAELGASGLTVDSAGYDIAFQQNFTDASAVDGLLMKTGLGTLSATSSTHARTVVTGGGLLVLDAAATFGRSLVVTNGASLSLQGAAVTLTAGDLTLGTTGVMTLLYMDSGDSIAVTNSTGLTVNSCGVYFGGTGVNGVYTLFRSTGATINAAVLNSVLLLNPVAGKNYAWAVVPDGADSTIQLTVSDLTLSDALWDGSEGTDWNTADNWTPSGVPASGTHTFFTDTGLEKTVDISTPAACSHLTFDASDPYLIQGGSLSIAGGSVSNALGSHTLSMPLTITGDFACQTVLASTTTVSGALFAPVSSTVSKNGSGTLAVSGNNTDFDGKWSTSGGRLLFAASGALGSANPATNAVTVGAGTLAYSGTPAAVTKGFVLNPGGISNAAIIEARSDLAVTGPISAQSGIFVKRGAGALSFDIGNGTRTLSAAGGSGGVNVTPSGTITLPESGDSLLTATGLGGFNVLEGTVRFKGNGPSVSILNQNHFGIIGGQFSEAQADPTLELDNVRMNQGGSGLHFLLGNQMSAASPARAPTLRLINGALLSLDHLRMGLSPTTTFTPTLIMSNATMSANWQISIGADNNTAPIVRLMQGSSANASGGNQYGGGVYVARNVDVVVAENSVLGQTNPGGSFRFSDSYSSGTMRWESGGTMRFAKFTGLNVNTASGVAMLFDGGVMEPVASGFSYSTATSKQSFVIEAGGLTVNTPAGVRHALTFPITGAGALAKTGPGELVFAEGVTYTTASATNALGVPITATGLATGNYTGGTDIQAGTLSVSNGTIRTDAGVAVAPGAALNLSAGSVTLSEVSGSGVISNGVLSAGYRCHVSETGNDILAFADVTLPTGLTVTFDPAAGYALTNRQVLAVATRSGTTDLNLAAWKAQNVGESLTASFTLVSDTVYAHVFFTGGTLILVN